MRKALCLLSCFALLGLVGCGSQGSSSESSASEINRITVFLDCGAGHFLDGENTKAISIFAGQTLKEIETPVYPTYKFIGWKDSSGKILDLNTFEIDFSLTIYAAWEKDAEWLSNHGAEPKRVEKGRMEYGLYPQTVVDDEKTIGKLSSLSPDAEFNRYYFLDGEFYCRYEAMPCEDGLGQFSNGNPIVSGKAYYFKVEPVTWEALDEEGLRWYAAMILDANTFSGQVDRATIDYGGGNYHSRYKADFDPGEVYANNYERSDLRYLINQEFLETLLYFSKDELSDVNVDNSAATLENASAASFVCLDTIDQAFPLSYSEMAALARENRQSKGTDFARARGLYVDDVSIGYSDAWTRSPTGYSGSGIWMTAPDGTLIQGQAYDEAIGIRPAIELKSALS